MSQKRPNEHLRELWLNEVEDPKDPTKFRYIIMARYDVSKPKAKPVRTLGHNEGYRTIATATQRASKVARKAGWTDTQISVRVGAIQVAKIPMLLAA
jgi:hypothetical protein